MIDSVLALGWGCNHGREWGEESSGTSGGSKDLKSRKRQMRQWETGERKK